MPKKESQRSNTRLSEYTHAPKNRLKKKQICKTLRNNQDKKQNKPNENEDKKQIPAVGLLGEVSQSGVGCVGTGT